MTTQIENQVINLNNSPSKRKTIMEGIENNQHNLNSINCLNSDKKRRITPTILTQVNKNLNINVDSNSNSNSNVNKLSKFELNKNINSINSIFINAYSTLRSANVSAQLSSITNEFENDNNSDSESDFELPLNNKDIENEESDFEEELEGEEENEIKIQNNNNNDKDKDNSGSDVDEINEEPLNEKIEADEALKVAREIYHVSSTDDCISLVGRNKEQINLQHYVNLVNSVEPQTIENYEQLECKIQNFNNQFNNILSTIASSIGVVTCSSVLEYARSIIKQFTTIMIKHCIENVCEKTTFNDENISFIETINIIKAAKYFGRPLDNESYYEQNYDEQSSEDESESESENESQNQNQVEQLNKFIGKNYVQIVDELAAEPSDDDEEFILNTNNNKNENESHNHDNKNETNNFLIPISLFDSLLKQILYSFNEIIECEQQQEQNESKEKSFILHKWKISDSAAEILQQLTETYIAKLFAGSYMIAKHANRSTISIEDMKLTLILWSNSESEIARKFKI
eukprot:TRINITY_DN309_c0_g1_i4.p1 TRINITY_DN309_c0_g1~~TRINITY_DN309_c0_g1_i4.p1  ORF type:complete len:517 (+),score=257.66 TRINITY_DN309_c0_g1_i4:55-1605(+)